MLDQWLLKPLHHPQGWRANVLTQALALALSSQACSAFAADYQPPAQALELAPVTVSARLNQESARDIPFGLSVLDEHTVRRRRIWHRLAGCLAQGAYHRNAEFRAIFGTATVSLRFWF